MHITHSSLIFLFLSSFLLHSPPTLSLGLEGWINPACVERLSNERDRGGREEQGKGERAREKGGGRQREGHRQPGVVREFDANQNYRATRVSGAD